MPTKAVYFRLIVALTIDVLFAATCFAQQAKINKQAVDQAVSAEMKTQQIVGVAIGVIQDAKIAYVNGYGLADVLTRTPVTDESVFNWASNSKPLIAVAAMQLVEDKMLDLDEPIGKYLSDLPDHLKKITTRQLLCHQSGIPHYSNGKVVPSGRKINSRQELDPFQCLHRFAMSPLIFAPGSKTDYSSYAYVVLSAVVQAAAKQPIEKQLFSKIGKPLVLGSFQLDLPLKTQRNWTSAYKIVGGSPQKVDDYAHSWKHGAGGYKSNVKDFARFAVALMNKELLDDETTELMWTPQTLKNGSVSPYGLGVVISGKGRDLKVSHNGSQDEVRTRMVIYPNLKHGIVVMCNTQDCDPGKISTAVYATLRAK